MICLHANVLFVAEGEDYAPRLVEVLIDELPPVVEVVRGLGRLKALETARAETSTYRAELAHLFGEPREPHAAGDHDLAHGHLLHHLLLCYLSLLRRLLLLRSLGRLNLPRHLLLGHRNRLLLQWRPCRRLILG